MSPYKLLFAVFQDYADTEGCIEEFAPELAKSVLKDLEYAGFKLLPPGSEQEKEPEYAKDVWSVRDHMADHIGDNLAGSFGDIAEEAHQLTEQIMEKLIEAGYGFSPWEIIEGSELDQSRDDYVRPEFRVKAKVFS